jgi:hypothetical protein
MVIGYTTRLIVVVELLVIIIIIQVTGKTIDTGTKNK